MSEQRRYPRISIELPASFQVIGPEENVSVATTLNISVGGLCLISRERLPVGQILRLKVELIPGETVQVMVTVVWAKERELLVMEEYWIGVELYETSSPEVIRFVQFCEQKIRDHAP